MTRWVSLIESRREIKLSTEFDYPPIPIRDFDWHALDANTYDASYEGEDENGSIWSVSGFVGTGRTENDAIVSLFEQLEDFYFKEKIKHGLHLDGADLSGANLNGADLSGAYVDCASFPKEAA